MKRTLIIHTIESINQSSKL